jgi:hypothetical protein
MLHSVTIARTTYKGCKPGENLVVIAVFLAHEGDQLRIRIRQ